MRIHFLTNWIFWVGVLIASTGWTLLDIETTWRTFVIKTIVALGYIIVGRALTEAKTAKVARG